MKTSLFHYIARGIAIAFVLARLTSVEAQERRELAIGQPDAIVDLRSSAGAALVQAKWQWTDARFTAADFKSPGPSASDPLALYPTGKSIKTNDLYPKFGTPDFEKASWKTLDPSKLDEREGTGLVSAGWYRLQLTLPAKLGKFDLAGATAVFEIVVDDYSEVWVNGKLNKAFGQSGEGVISGFNARQRVRLSADAKAGQTFDIAILTINGPLADIPQNYIWLRSATLDFYKKYPANPEWSNVGKIVTADEALKAILDPEAPVVKLADGFQFTEGPVWSPEGYLLFSDPNANVIYRYDPTFGNVSVYMTKTGYTGIDIGEYHQPGSNGLAVDSEGRLIVCQHGNRQVVRIEKKGPVTVLSDRFDGKRLNSPNDLVLKSDGGVYFTDPPYGLPNAYADTRKETPYQGVYRVKDGKTELLTTALGGPNGIAFSPDEKYLYVGNWDIRDVWHTKQVWRFDVKSDGTLGEGQPFLDFTQTDEPEAIDGIKVDYLGNLFVSAPGGVWIFSPAGKYLGKITGPERPANMAWGDADGKTLYLTAHTGLYKIRVKTGNKNPEMRGADMK